MIARTPVRIYPEHKGAVVLGRETWGVMPKTNTRFQGIVVSSARGLGQGLKEPRENRVSAPLTSFSIISNVVTPPRVRSTFTSLAIILSTVGFSLFRVLSMLSGRRLLRHLLGPSKSLV